MQRPGPGAGLDHDEGVAERGQEAVSGQKASTQRGGARWKWPEHGARALADRCEE
jgi:hypothetical protein